MRFGDGVTAEVGMDLKNMKARKVIDPTLYFLPIDKSFQVGVFTDPNVAKLRPMKTVSISVNHNDPLY